MSRFLKVLSLVLALASLGIFAMSCGSSNAQVRVINAVDEPSQNTLDVYINGNDYFPNVAPDDGDSSVYPTPSGSAANYISIPSGDHSIQAFIHTQTSSPVISTAYTFSGSTQYTLLLSGYANGTPTATPFADNNTLPATGQVGIRVINASAFSAASGGIGYAIWQNGSTVPTPTNLAFNSTSGVQYVNFEPGTEFFIQVYLGNSIQFTSNFTPGGTASAGSVTTIVIMDNQGGASINSQPLVLTDLN